MPKVQIVENADGSTDVEILAQAIEDVAMAAKKLLSSRLKIRAICLLIQDAAPGRIGLNTIQDVLETAGSLNVAYLVKKGGA